MNNYILIAARVAAGYHQQQVRKYTGAPYIVHPARVAARLTRHPLGTEEGVCAAWLHDVLEDCETRPRDIRLSFPDEPILSEDINYFLGKKTDERHFGERVADLILELTNPSKQHPELPRAERKKMDRDHLLTASVQAKLIKLIDRTDNLLEIGNAPADFVQVYGEESKLLFEVLSGTDVGLEQEYIAALHAALRKVGRP